jgi:AcrR family transcriptional regulator
MSDLDEGRRTRRQRQAEERRQEILAAALDTFAEHGYDGSTTREIARRAGVAEGLIYHYFPSKRALLDAMLRRYSLLPVIREMTETRPAGSPEQVLTHRVREFAALLERRRPVVTVLLREAQVNPEVASAFAAVVQEGAGLLIRYLREQTEAGQIRQNADLETAVLLLIKGHLVDQLLEAQPQASGGHTGTDTSLESSVRVLLHGLMRPGAEGTQP